MLTMGLFVGKIAFPLPSRDPFKQLQKYCKQPHDIASDSSGQKIDPNRLCDLFPLQGLRWAVGDGQEFENEYSTWSGEIEGTADVKISSEKQSWAPENGKLFPNFL